MVGWLVGLVVCWVGWLLSLFGLPVSLFHFVFVCRVVCSLNGWLVVLDWLAGWLPGWLVGWLLGWLVGWLAGSRFACLLALWPAHCCCCLDCCCDW